MKKLLLLGVFAFSHFLVKAQCSLQDSVVDVTCYNACNGMAYLTPSGVAPYSYLWSPGGQTTQNVSGLCAGTYTAVMQDNNGCVATATVVITQPSQITVSVPTVPATCSSCADGSATANATGGFPPYTYNWIPQGGSNQTLTGLNPGTYSVTVTDSHGCPVGSLYTVGNSVGIKDQAQNTEFSISPNPASDVVVINKTFSSPVSAVVTVTNMLGQTMMTLHSGTAEKLHTTLNVSDLPAGVYYVTVVSPEGKALSRFVKN